MIFIGGVGSHIKAVGAVEGTCPACGRSASLHVTKKYSVVTLFFIPVIPFGAEYIATCPSCASLMELRRDKGKQIEKQPGAILYPDDLQVLKNNRGITCSRCGARVQPGQNYCPTCGERLD